MESAAKKIEAYKNFIVPGFRYIKGRFTEKVDVLAKGFLYKIFQKKTFLFDKSVVYPFVQFRGHKKRFFLSMEEFFEVLN